MFTIEEVANELKLHKMTIYRMIERGWIKAIKIGKSWRITEKELKKLKREGAV